MPALTLANWPVALAAMAIVGLWRRVAWGRFLVSFIYVCYAFAPLLFVIPSHDDPPGERGLEPVFGYLPPTWIAWSIAVAAAILLLTPLVIIGWKKDSFRSAWW